MGREEEGELDISRRHRDFPSNATRKRENLAHPGAEEPFDIRKSYDLDVLIEDGGGKLKESEGDSGCVRERRGIAKAKDVVLDFEW